MKAAARRAGHSPPVRQQQQQALIIPCQLCSTARGPMHCSECVSIALADRRQSLLAAARKSATLQEGLALLLASRDERLQRQQRKQQQAAAIRAAASRVEDAGQALAKVRSQTLHLKAENARRREELEGARDTVAGERSKTLGHVLPDSLRNCALQFDRVGFDLMLERHIKMRDLQKLLPLTMVPLPSSPAASGSSFTGVLNGQHSRPSPRASKIPLSEGPLVTIGGLRLPEGSSPAADDGQEAQELGAALGYLLLFVDLAAVYLGSPLLHYAGFKGSCSTLWMPNSFWEASQPYQGRRLRLHRVPPIPPTEHAPGVSTSSEDGSRGLDILGENPVAKRTIEMLTAFKQRSARSLWGGIPSSYQSAAPPSIGRSSIGKPPSGVKTGDGGSHGVEMGQPQLERALHSLYRSLGALVADQLGSSKMRPPHEYGPFAVFAALCASTLREPLAAGHSGGVPTQFGASSMFPAGDPIADSILRAASTIYEGEVESDPAEDWDIIARPGAGWGAATLAGGARSPPLGAALLLPPLPSQPDATEQWTRAMFTDHVGENGATHQAGGVSPLMDRLHQLDTFARHLSVAQLLALKDRLLGTGDDSSDHI